MIGGNKKCKQNFVLSSSWEESTWGSGVQITFMTIIGKMRPNSDILYIIEEGFFFSISRDNFLAR